MPTLGNWLTGVVTETREGRETRSEEERVFMTRHRAPSASVELCHSFAHDREPSLIPCRHAAGVVYLQRAANGAGPGRSRLRVRRAECLSDLRATAPEDETLCCSTLFRVSLML
jgi:hypothetical protein